MTSVDEVVAAIGAMSEEERGQLIVRLVEMDELIEDIEDVLALMRSAHETARPFDEFIAELRAEGRDV